MDVLRWLREAVERCSKLISCHVARCCSFDGVFRMVREEGASSLFRGVGPNVARAVLMNASQLAT